MIKFFNKIRMKLLAESPPPAEAGIRAGRFSKYLLYAIGEIALVMIGILLALQVNNWNAQRKLQETNEVLLKKLVGEFNLNINRMIFLDLHANENGKSMGLQAVSLRTDTALRYIDQGLDSMKIKWLLETRLIQGSTLNLHASVYEEMKSTGRLYSLGSDSLLHKINRYYGLLERESFYTDDANKRLFDRWSECKYGYMVFRIKYRTQGISVLEDHQWLFDQKSMNYQDLQVAIHESSRITKINRGRMKAVIEESEALKAELIALLNSGKR